jgi:6-phosphogluconolactonase
MQAAAERIAAALQVGLASRGRACAALSGGSTPGPAYERLGELPVDWAKVSFALVDERCVPAGDPASNEGLLRRTLSNALSRGAQIVPLYDGAPTLDAIERAYAGLRFDIAVLGMGEDGHTASWFPGATGLSDTLDLSNARSVVSAYAPGAVGAPQRLTLTRAALLRAEQIMLLLTGEKKRERLASALAGPVEAAPVAALFSGFPHPPAVLWAP